MAAYLFDDCLELISGLVGRGQAHEAIEPAVQIGLVYFEGAVGKIVAPASDGASALEEPFQAGREHRVASVDGVLDIADEMGEADLVLAHSPPHLAAVPIRDPII